METIIPQKSVRWLAPLLLSTILILAAVAATAQTEPASGTAILPEWLEPRGLSIVELVGQVPDTYLQGMIISYDDGEGIIVYQSGSRNGSTVIINTIIYPRFSDPAWAGGKMTAFGCLGQTPRYDHLGAVVPQSYLRIWDSTGRERTGEIRYMYLSQMNNRQPSAGTDAYVRYPTDEYGPYLAHPLPAITPDGLTIPGNSGCRLEIPGQDYYPLTGVFELELVSETKVAVVGSQEGAFQSYIGGANVGIFQRLMDQLLTYCGERHGRIQLYVPAHANYFLVRYPPMPGDAYTDDYDTSERPYENQARLSSGTYRLGEISELGADLTFSAAFPLDAVWQDADQTSAGTEFLPLLTSATKLAPPEYALPAGVPFNDCFTYGNCPSSVLQQVCDAWMTLKVFYLTISRPADGTEHTPIKMAGPAWSALVSENTQPTTESTVDSSLLTSHIYLPLITYPERCAAYPCGWFDAAGRMLGYEP